MLKWEQVREGTHHARCGHLHVRVEEGEAFKEPGHPDYEPAQCEWFVEPDEEDKSYRRALATGDAPTVGAAKESAERACHELTVAMIASLQ